jgi:hypothetical protein
MGTSPAVTASETMDRTVCLELRDAQSAGLEHGVGTVDLTYLLTPWSRVLLEKLKGFQLV